MVLEDADVAAAAKVCAAARMVNGGQSCIAGKRFIVVRSVRRAFEKALVDAMRALRDGRSARPGDQVGPLQSVDARDEIHAQVEESIAKGARLLLGGEVPDRPGAWYPPTVLTDVCPASLRTTRKCSAPSPRSSRRDDEADAIRIANASEFGLGSGVLTRDLGAASASPPRSSRPASASSTRTSARIRACRSAASSIGLRPRMLGLRHPRVRQHQDRAREAARRVPASRTE